jgi:hypothetical protein
VIRLVIILGLMLVVVIATQGHLDEQIGAMIVELDKCGFDLWDGHWDHCESGMAIFLLFSIVYFLRDRWERRSTKEPMSAGSKIFWVLYVIFTLPVYGKWAAPWVQ